MNVNRILDVIDVGLQQDARTDWAMGVGPEGWCVRCQRHEPVDGDLCPGCRAFLLEDSDEDPGAQPWNLPWGLRDLPPSAVSPAIVFGCDLRAQPVLHVEHRPWLERGDTP